MSLEINIEDERWDALGLPDLARKAVKAAFEVLNIDPNLCEVDLLACDDNRIAELNSQFRDKPRATNVLSWPATDLGAEVAGNKPALPQADFTGEIVLGDIAIAYDTCLREAAAGNKSADDHVTHLIVHGLLHLLGYDHVRDPDATLMQGLEVEILGILGIDDPYWDMTGP